MNDASKEPQEADKYGTSSPENWMRLSWSFCGGTYPKFGEQPKGGA